MSQNQIRRTSYAQPETEEQKLTRSKLKDVIASILEIPNTDSWDIFDSIPEKDLYLVHYTDKADLNIYGQIRGVVVDIENKHVVCRSYSYSPTAVSDNLEVKNNILTIEDNSGMIHQIEKENIQIKRGYEGTLIRFFKHRGTIYPSTHKKINCNRSKWGNSITFIEMYKELVNEDPQNLFDKNESDSPIVQLFILVHKDVQNVSKYDFSDGGFSIYLGGKLAREVEDEKKYEKYFNLNIFATNSEEIINIDEANEFLNSGFYPSIKLNKDKRLNPGEFVMIYNVKNGQVLSSIKVQSTGYNWRTFVRNNNPNICHQFYMLFNYLNPQALNDKFPAIPYVSEKHIENILKTKPIISWPTNNSKNEVSKGIYRFWASMILAVPLHKQVTAFRL
ncbi:MAG TPA: hypothetical protein VN703_01495, partial [Candidatus Sulfopaludibacter sp.]|nr:hypothetical protein [Candidatus Sulfopaludibacter sp.]